MPDDRRLVQLYNEEENEIINFIEYKRLAVYDRIYALLQPADDMDQLVPFRVEGRDSESGEEQDEVYIYVVDSTELEAVEVAWRRLHS